MSRSIGRRVAAFTGVLVAGVAGYLLLWPVPADPQAWLAPTPPGYTGAHATNHRLAGLQNISLGDDFGPEHIVLGPDGKLYAAMTSGNLLRMERDGSELEVFANTGGRVLGFDFDARGNMIAADAMRGLLAITPEAGIAVLADRLGADDPIRYANSVVVARDGRIYFTDASGRFAPKEWGGTYEASLFDILEQAATGRVLVHDPVTARTEVVAHGLSFANGIALSADGLSLFVAETGRYRIWKIDSGARDLDVGKGTPLARPLFDSLPGYPDNLMRGLDGRIWAGLFRPRNPAADSLAGRPFVRKILLRLPRFLLPVGRPYGHVFAFDEEGRVTEDWQDPSGAYPETTGVTETPERLYIHSLHAPTLGWAPRVSERSAPDALETIYVLRSIREAREMREPAPAGSGGCDAARTGFEPASTDAERFFSFWSVRTDVDGRVVDAMQREVGRLRGCFGPTAERARQNFQAEIELGDLSFRGRGECLALLLDRPEPGLFPVRCQLVLDGLPAPFVGGLLTTNTITSRAALGGDSDPPGYTQASIATIRLWKGRTPSQP